MCQFSFKIYDWYGTSTPVVNPIFDKNSCAMQCNWKGNFNILQLDFVTIGISQVFQVLEISISTATAKTEICHFYVLLLNAYSQSFQTDHYILIQTPASKADLVWSLTTVLN